jgi:hypothetical protein
LTCKNVNKTKSYISKFEESEEDEAMEQHFVEEHTTQKDVREKNIIEVETFYKSVGGSTSIHRGVSNGGSTMKGDGD